MKYGMKNIKFLDDALHSEQILIYVDRVYE